MSACAEGWIWSDHRACAEGIPGAATARAFAVELTARPLVRLRLLLRRESPTIESADADKPRDLGRLESDRRCCIMARTQWTE